MRLLTAISEALGRCPPGWRLTRAVTEIPDPRLARHLRHCERCAAELDSLRELFVNARAAFTEPEPMSEAERDAVSLHLLASALLPPQRRRRSVAKAVVAGVALAATGTLVAIAVRRTETPRTQITLASHASVRATGQATFSRVQAPPDELLRLDEGAIDLEVTPLVGTERFRVLTADAEVEVRGTTFRVVAHDRRLMAVTVSRGRVEVRPFEGGVAVLDAGDSWAPGIPTEAEQSHGAHADSSGPPPSAHPAATRTSSDPSASSSRGRRSERSGPPNQLFDRAWTLLRTGNAKAAAEAFGDVVRLSPGSALEEDALYWRAVSTARAKDTAAAAQLFVEFLARFPSSSRAGEASVALGWIRIEEGRFDDATMLFTVGLRDPSPEVRASAKDGLRRTR